MSLVRKWKRDKLRAKTYISVSKSFLSYTKFLVLICVLSIGSLLSVLLRDDGAKVVFEHSQAQHGDPIMIDDGDIYHVNNFGPNDNLKVLKDRQRDVHPSELKTILMWNDAYGVREYDIGHGRQPFYQVGIFSLLTLIKVLCASTTYYLHFQQHLCPETRCIATANRSFLPSVADFDAILIHQRGIDWKDMPKVRKPHQRYVQWIFESQQYLYMDIHELNNYFNWTMSFVQESDFFIPYVYTYIH